MVFKIFNKNKKENKEKLDKSRKEEIETRVEKDMVNEEPSIQKNSKEWKRKKKKKVNEHILKHNKMLDMIAPKGNIKFDSIDFTFNGGVGTILTFVIQPGKFNRLSPLWGIDSIPKLLNSSISNNSRLKNKKIEAKIFHSFQRRPDNWAESKIDTATEVANTGVKETSRASQILASKIFYQHYKDVQEIAEELKEGATYLDLSIRVAIKAPTREDLQEAISIVEKEYGSIFGSTVDLVPFVCEQDKEYANMLGYTQEQLGENYMLTSRELAGSYMFVTRGINDPYGAYIGQLAGEVNNDPVLLDATNFKNLAVVYARDRGSDLSSKYRQDVRYNFKATTAWGVKIMQDALVKQQKVVEFVLNGEEPLKVGHNLRNITAYVPMDEQEASINFFQAFSKGFDEIPAYSILVDKLRAFIEQFNTSKVENDDTILLQSDFDSLESIIKEFYIYKGMWQDNPHERKEDLRLLNLPNNEYPVLAEFLFFLNFVLENERSESQVHRLANKMESVIKLQRIIERIYNRHNDIFGRHTTVSKDYIRKKERIIFDFKRLNIVSTEALMAQFINTFSYAEEEVEEGDVIIIHGMDKLTRPVIDYLQKRITELNDRDVKIVLMYENQDILFTDEREFRQHNNWFINAEMRITNSMSAKNIKRYEELLHLELPQSVKRGMGGSDTHTYFLNRDQDAVMFNIDYQL
ncbi:hypothetical protein [Staphylococcus hyicus]|uniref:hypothetical protein n=1 Tax=Staphylococcus hyicus TaxID=1284 RepID=UPI00313328A6